MPNIPIKKHQIWFRSALFEIETGEDKETNPLCYGRQLARWLKFALQDEGITVKEVFPEDWGWCVMVKKAPFSLWVGCGNVHTYDTQAPADSPPLGKDVVWTCIVVAEIPLLKKLFRAPNTALEVDNLLMRVRRILSSAPSTLLIDEP